MFRMKTHPKFSDDDGGTWVHETLVQEFVESYPEAVWILGGISQKAEPLDGAKYTCVRN
jgi:hypothetical protein